MTRPEERNEYMREYRARRKAGLVGPNAPKPPEPEGLGAVERTVRDACAKWPKALEQPETVAIAIELARVMDSGASTAKTQASAQLTKILDSLRGGNTHGRLAQLREGVVRERDS